MVPGSNPASFTVRTGRVSLYSILSLGSETYRQEKTKTKNIQYRIPEHGHDVCDAHLGLMAHAA